MKKIFFFLPALCLLLSACLPAPAAQTSEVLETSEVLPTPTPAPTETPTPTPAPPEHPSAFDPAFEQGVIVFQDGQWLARVTFTGENGQPQQAYYQIIPDTFNANDELAAKNPLAPLTVRARPLTPPPLPVGDPLTGAGGQGVGEVTLIFHPDTAEFRLAPALPAVFDGVNTDAPRFNPEAYARLPRFAVEDIQSGLAVQSLLLHIQERLASGESLSDILYIDPQATRSAWEKLGGNSLFFKLRPDGKAAWLKAKGNDKSARDQRYDNLTMKVLPCGAQIRLNGQDYFAFYIANFDPLDAQNPDPLDLANWKFFLGISTISGEPVDYSVHGFDFEAPELQKKGTSIPWVFLYGDEQYRQNHPFFDALLKIEGNDVGKLPFPAYEQEWNFEDFWPEGLNGVENSPIGAYERIVGEVYSDKIIYSALPFGIQRMLFIFDVRTPF